MSLWRCPQCGSLYGNLYTCPTCHIPTEFATIKASVANQNDEVTFSSFDRVEQLLQEIRDLLVWHFRDDPDVRIHSDRALFEALEDAKGAASDAVRGVLAEHFCARCHHRWRGDAGPEYCGDCHRAWPFRAWQPIETAPKDGTTILVFQEAIGTAYWFEGTDGSHGWIVHDVARDDWTRSASHRGVDPPTHWMPLPEQPEPAPAVAKADQ